MGTLTETWLSIHWMHDELMVIYGDLMGFTANLMGFTLW